MHGCGVNTPSAADVAAATWGFVSVVHIPKGMTLVNGWLSITEAAGRLAADTMLVGNTFSTEGATPNVQLDSRR